MCTRVTSVRAQFPGTDDLSVAVGHPELVHQAGLADPFLPARQDRTHTLFQSTSGVGGQEGELVVAPDEDRIGRDGPGREGGWILQGNSMSLLRGFPHRDVQAYACFLFRVFFSVRKGVSCPEASWGGHVLGEGPCSGSSEPQVGAEDLVVDEACGNASA